MRSINRIQFGVLLMNLRRLLFSLVVACALGAAYIASPFLAMWNLREAIKNADTATIESRVVWPTVRESLKSSLTGHANLLPLANAAGSDVTPTLWQRLKGVFGATVLDRFIETYVTPQGLPKLFDYKRMWNEQVAGDSAEPPAATRWERMRQLWARVKRAEFQTLTRVEVEVQDRKVADRRYVSVMELDGLTWKLTRLRIIAVDPAKRLAELERKSRLR
jgi:Protein of unknown function (DUF2939)